MPKRPNYPCIKSVKRLCELMPLVGLATVDNAQRRILQYTLKRSVAESSKDALY